MNINNIIREFIDCLEQDIKNKDFLTYIEIEEWEDYIKRIINYSNKEKDKEIERLKEELTILVKDDERNQETIINLGKENEELKSIIKQVREKIESVELFGLIDGKTPIATLLYDILEILDKGV